MRHARFLSLAFLVGLATASIHAAPWSIAATPFRPARHGEVVVPVWLEGAGPFLFLVDTGSSHSSIADDLAQAINAPAVARTTVTSSTGDHMGIVVRVDRLDVGPLAAQGLLPTVVARAALDPTGRIRGVIGQDVLARTRYTLDFRNRQIVWQDTGREPPGSVLTLRFERERFLVDLPQRDSVLRLVPDSGADGLVLFERNDITLPPMTRTPGRVWLSTLSDQREVQPVNVHELRIGETTWRDVHAVLVDRHDADASVGDGLLPLSLFDRVTFDGPAGLLIVEPRSPNSPESQP